MLTVCALYLYMHMHTLSINQIISTQHDPQAPSGQLPNFAALLESPI